MLLGDGDITLRTLEAEDLDTLYRWENDTSTWSSSSVIAPFSRKQLWEYINSYDGDIFSSRQIRFMIVANDSGSRVGMIDLYDFDPVNRRASVGILVDKDFRQSGYGKQSLAILETYCRDRLGLHQLCVMAECGNKASLALFEGAGFCICGRLRSWLRHGESYVDVFVLQKLFS